MMGRPAENQGNAYFATTQWSMVVAAGAVTPQAGAALTRLCQAYWVPLYSFLRRKGYQPSEAEDLVQGFFTRLIEKAVVAAADRNRGKFRSFLISSLQHYVADERDRQQAGKRGGKAQKLSLDFGAAEETYSLEPYSNLTPEKVFERRWALELINQVLAQLKKEYVEAGKAEAFRYLSPCLTRGSETVGYAEIGGKLGISADAAKMAASRLRRRYGELLRQTIADTVETPADIDDEIRYLFNAIAG
jgi:RNA polymerase sigma-70 factor (ECF subfamily)